MDEILLQVWKEMKSCSQEEELQINVDDDEKVQMSKLLKDILLSLFEF